MTNRGAEETPSGGIVHAPRGTALSCKGWEQEAALRMLMNCADPEVAERLAAPIAGPGAGAGAGNARDWEGFRATLAALRELESDQTLLVRAGGPVALFRTRAEAPRVVLATNRAANPSEAASANWLYLGTQSGLPTAYEAFAAAARKHFDGTLAGRLVVACGMGATGGAQALAATLNGAAFLGVDADPEQIKRRVKTGYCEAMVNDLDEALRILKNAARKREAASVGLIGNCAQVIPELASRGIVPDLLTDQTPADDLRGGYIPSGLSTEQARELWSGDPQSYRQRAQGSMATQARGILELKRLGSLAFRFPDFAAEYIPPLLSAGRRPLLWVALSGEPGDIARADRLALEIFAGDEAAARWIRLASRHVQFQGLPARVSWVDKALRAKFGLALNDLVAQGALKAPIVIGGGVLGVGVGVGTETSHRAGTTEADGSSDAAPTSSTLDALLDGLRRTQGAGASAGSWVEVQEQDRRDANDANTEFPGGSRSQLLAYAVVADGTAEMARRIERVLSDDPGEMDASSADAGSTRVTEAAGQAPVKIPRP